MKFFKNADVSVYEYLTSFSKRKQKKNFKENIIILLDSLCTPDYKVTENDLLCIQMYIERSKYFYENPLISLSGLPVYENYIQEEPSPPYYSTDSNKRDVNIIEKSYNQQYILDACSYLQFFVNNI